MTPKQKEQLEIYVWVTYIFLNLKPHKNIMVQTRILKKIDLYFASEKPWEEFRSIYSETSKLGKNHYTHV